MIDSDEQMADRMAEILQREEMPASTACETEEALWRIDDEPPDAVILTLGVPDTREEDTMPRNP